MSYCLELVLPTTAERRSNVIGSRLESVSEGNVAGIHVNHEDSVAFEKPKDRLDFRPAGAELLRFFRAPIRHDFIGEVRREIQRGAGEIEDEGSAHDGHLDDPKFVVSGKHFGNGATTDVRDLARSQTQIDVSFLTIVGLVFKRFDGRDSLFRLAFHYKYATMNSLTEGTAQKQTVSLTVLTPSAQKLRSIAHEHTTSQCRRPLRRRADSLACERFCLAGRAARPRVPRPENSGRSSSLRRRDHLGNRRRRKTLVHPPPQRNPRRTAKDRDFTARRQWVQGLRTVVSRDGGDIDGNKPSMLQWVHGPRTVVMARLRKLLDCRELPPFFREVLDLA